MLMATKFRDLRAWASSGLPLAERLAEVYCDAARLELVWTGLLADVDNTDEAVAVLQPAVTRVCCRLNSAAGEGFTDGDGFRAADVLGLLRAIVALRRSLGLAAPGIPQVTLPDAGKWWLATEEGPAALRYRYLDVREETHNGMMSPKLFLLTGDFAFSVGDDGSLLKATRK
jgi:hypothetical protein